MTERPATGADIVTQIQEHLDRLAVSLFSTTGALQRDAQPASVRGEAALPLPTATNSKDLAKDWAAEMMAASRMVDKLIHCLPSVEATEEEQLQGIARLMAENDMVGEELREEVQLTERQLEEVRAIYAVLADAELEKRTLQKAE